MALWTPEDDVALVAALVAKWDLRTSADITLSGSNISNIANAGSGSDFAQATSSQQPDYSATGFSGGPGASFNADNQDVLDATIVLDGAGLGLVCIGNTTPLQNRRLISLGASGVEDWNSDSTAILLGHANNSSKHFISSRNGAEVILKNTPASAFDFLASVDYDGSNLRSWLDGTATGTTAKTGSFNATRLTLGAQSIVGGGNWDHATCVHAEGRVYNRALTTAERQMIEGYLAWRADGGVAGTQVGRLPSGHPYKSAAPTTGGGVTGAGAATLAITPSASGAHGVAGTGAATLALTPAGAGTFTTPVTGAGAATLSLTPSGSGAHGVSGVGAASLAITPAGVGTAGNVTGIGAATLDIAPSGTGAHGVAGAGAAALEITPAGIGAVAVNVTGIGASELIIVPAGVGRYGGFWLPTPPTPETWSSSSVTSEAWPPNPPASGTWTPQ